MNKLPPFNRAETFNLPTDLSLINRLPDDLILSIFLCLGPSFIFTIARVSRGWKNLTSSETLWQSIVYRHLGLTPIDQKKINEGKSQKIYAEFIRNLIFVNPQRTSTAGLTFGMSGGLYEKKTSFYSNFHFEPTIQQIVVAQLNPKQWYQLSVKTGETRKFSMKNRSSSLNGPVAAQRVNKLAIFEPDNSERPQGTLIYFQDNERIEWPVSELISTMTFSDSYLLFIGENKTLLNYCDLSVGPNSPIQKQIDVKLSEGGSDPSKNNIAILRAYKNRIAILYNAESIGIWNLETEKLEKLFPFNIAVEVFYTESQLIILDDSAIKILDLNNSELKLILTDIDQSHANKLYIFMKDKIFPHFSESSNRAFLAIKEELSLLGINRFGNHRFVSLPTNAFYGSYTGLVLRTDFLQNSINYIHKNNVLQSTLNKIIQSIFPKVFVKTN